MRTFRRQKIGDAT